MMTYYPGSRRMIWPTQLEMRRSPMMSLHCSHQRKEHLHEDDVGRSHDTKSGEKTKEGKEKTWWRNDDDDIERERYNQEILS